MMVLVFNPIILGGRSRQISVNWNSAQRERERERSINILFYPLLVENIFDKDFFLQSAITINPSAEVHRIQSLK